MSVSVLAALDGLRVVTMREEALVDPLGGVQLTALEALVVAAVSLKHAGHRVVVAIESPSACGRDYLPAPRGGASDRVVSQTQVMAHWNTLLDARSELAAQILVDAVVFHNRHRAQQLADVLTELTDMGVMPIVAISAVGAHGEATLLGAFVSGLLEKRARARAGRSSPDYGVAANIGTGDLCAK